jgi:hypothetical protein
MLLITRSQKYGSINFSLYFLLPRCFQRGCLFDKERITSFQKIYSQSDCNVDCRMMSIQAMCHCIPFMIPFSNSDTVCTLADIPCLKQIQRYGNIPFLEHQYICKFKLIDKWEFFVSLWRRYRTIFEQGKTGFTTL